MLIAEVDDRHNHRMKIEPLISQPILKAERPILVGYTPEHAFFHKFIKPLGCYAAGDTKPNLEVLKATHAQKAVSQHEEGPALSDH